MARDLINTDKSKMSELKFKTVIRLLTRLEKGKEDTIHSFIIDIKELKSSQAKIKKNTITEI